jgi:hypothetical protein
MTKDIQIEVIAYLAMALFLCISTVALAKTEVVISKKNRFGGMTKKSTILIKTIIIKQG